MSPQAASPGAVTEHANQRPAWSFSPDNKTPIRR
jgi:hypothetical protein